MQKNRPSIPTININSNVFQSFAKGGFGSAWGASVLPYNDTDISDWPIKNYHLKNHYKEIFEYMPLSGSNDTLSEFFPLYKENLSKIKIDKRSQQLLNDIAKE